MTPEPTTNVPTAQLERLYADLLKKGDNQAASTLLAILQPAPTEPPIPKVIEEYAEARENYVQELEVGHSERDRVSAEQRIVEAHVHLLEWLKNNIRCVND